MEKNQIRKILALFSGLLPTLWTNTNYGVEVIGIGQETNSGANRHNLSQGHNPFLISGPTYNQADQYFFTGHNGANLALTSSGVPNNSQVIQRLQRIWRVDERNNFGNVHFKIDENDIPAAPPGYTKLVLLVDETSANFPNFSLASTVVKEILLTSGTTHQVDYNFADNAFYTLAWLKPQVQFGISESSAFEGDSPPLPSFSTYSVPVTLNYQPISTFSNTIDYIFVDAGQTAEAADYQYNTTAQAAGLSIGPSLLSANLSFDIANDNFPDEESTEQFLIILKSDSNTTFGLGIGERDTLTFYILDDDPPPNGSFVTSSADVFENAGSIYIKVQRTGDPDDMDDTASKIRIRRKASPNEGTALYNNDYSLLTADGWKGIPAIRMDTVSFPAAQMSSQIDSIKITINDDLINEDNETVNLVLEGAENIAINSSSITEFQLNIIEDDPLPEVNFLVDNQTGYESVGAPVILVKLDRPSSRDVEVQYSIDTDASTAEYDHDYTGATDGTIEIEPGDTLTFPAPFNVDNGDLPGEPDETVIFYLNSASNATIGTGNEHTYTIIDYAPFEWKGAAGVGKNSDNIVWVDANRMSPPGIQTSINNFSPRDIDITRKGGDDNRATLIANGINTRKSIEFDGIDNSSNADCYKIDDNSFTNLAGTSQKKVFFMVVKPTDVPTVSVSNYNTQPTAANCRILYEEGGNSRGLSIYLYNSKLYFHGWNYPSNPLSGEEVWGFNSGLSTNADKVASATYARSTQDIVASTSYIITCIFDDLSDEPLMVYVNGVKGEMSSNINTPSDVGKLTGHTGDIGLGALTNQGLIHFSVKTPGERRCPFKGLLSEFIMFHEPQMNEVRRTIIENYLSAKYNIPLDNSNTRQIFDPAFADLTSNPNNDFNQEVAGVGQILFGTDTLYHGDAQGPSILRVKEPSFTGNPAAAFLEWGHNGESLTNTWPYSYWNAELPTGVQERSGMVWKMFESPDNTVSTVDMYINFSASANASALNDTAYLKLLVNTSSDPQDFSSASVYHVTEVKSGNVAFFNAVPVTNGMYFTLGNSSPISLFPLPIELLSFSAKLTGDYVDLNWSTASEINNDRFEIERAGSDLKWEKIDEVPGAGNSNTTLYYSDIDRNPLRGISYYRLRQVDFDGNYKYSDVVSVVNAGLNDREEVFIYPNPVHGGSVILHIPSVFSKGNITIRVFDLSGKILFKQTLSDFGNTSELNIERLDPGAYLIQIHSDYIDETRKLIVN